MAGDCASAAKGQAHQIWRARKTTASAPPIPRPSAVKRRISSRGAPGSRSSRSTIQFVWSGRKRKPRRRNMRSNRLAEAAQERQAPSYNIQPRNEWFVCGARVSSPRHGVSCLTVGQMWSCLGDRSSLVSVISVISEYMSQNFLSSYCHSEQPQGLVTHFGQFEQGRGRQFFQLQISGFGQLEKLQQISQSFPGIAIG